MDAIRKFKSSRIFRKVRTPVSDNSDTGTWVRPHNSTLRTPIDAAMVNDLRRAVAEAPVPGMASIRTASFNSANLFVLRCRQPGHGGTLDPTRPFTIRLPVENIERGQCVSRLADSRFREIGHRHRNSRRPISVCLASHLLLHRCILDCSGELCSDGTR